jgi:hydroxymethylpyrimidine/phosphomethylpyrimidine kinase
MTTTQTKIKRPTVVCFSGHDPCGGAGIQADIETIRSHHCHAATVITCLTAQNTQNVLEIYPQTAEMFTHQATTLLDDISPDVFKIGLIGSSALVLAIAALLKKFPNVPVVFDPILAAGGGQNLADEILINTLRDALLPLTTILTPNVKEVFRLTNSDTIDTGSKMLLEMGCQFVLITGADESTADVNNCLFHHSSSEQNYSWKRLSERYHGSGCTLAASIASLIAQGVPISEAVADAQEYTWHSLAAAYQTGLGQDNPDRFFWRYQ